MGLVTPRLQRLTLLTVLVLSASLPGHALFGGRTAAAEKAGALLYRDKGCAHCHGADGAGTKKATNLTGLRKNKDWPAEKITHQILEGGKKMPPFGDSLSDEQIAQLVAFLRAKHWRVLPPTMPPSQ
jgi:mono/diheme cytochrome c family protein